jgi:hypothetical protein
VAWDVPGGEAVLLDSERGHRFPLNPTATAVWVCPSGNWLLEEFRADLYDRFDVTEDPARGDVAAPAEPARVARGYRPRGTKWL